MTKSLKLFDDLILKSKHNNRPFTMDLRYLESPDKKPVVIFIHGFKGFKDWGAWNIVADHFAQAGFVFIKFNLSHNGTTLENPTDFADLEAFSQNNFSIELDDTQTVIDFLHDKNSVVEGLDLNKIFLIGHSRGGGVALIKSFEDSRVKGVVTWASVSDFNNLWPEELFQSWKANGVHYIANARTNQQMPMKYQIVEDYNENIQRLKIETAVKNFQNPILIIHGSDDPTVPVSHARDIYEWNTSSELEIIKGANHVFEMTHPFDKKLLPSNTEKVIEKTLTFLRKL